ncbi:Candidate phosphomevalonate decarboxylase; COG1355, Predicted dioxygenase [hydrothermal vent metagenome]|uniref:Candidate phosphomevalonate decarboxylase COG1355, Predicted dioxygenase n=1 Tax=hydrothermal vent metagenome TaxID=652676 RepID=A0A3B1DAT3_9ZZZZ
MMRRKARVAGYFYPATRDEIEETISGFGEPKGMGRPALGLVSPHAGYIYSGPVAAKVYSRVKVTGAVIMIGPNHGSNPAFTSPPPVAIMASGEWELPSGNLSIESGLAEFLMEESTMIVDSPEAHADEHSLEVQAPFLTHYYGDVTIVPILLARVSDESILTLAEEIYRGIKRYGGSVTLLASTDFSHYVPHDFAKSQDRKAIDRIIALDGEGLLEVVRMENISMCGAQPTAAVMEVCKKMGATKAELVAYQTSGDASHDYTSVVGYGGLIIR